MLNPLIHQLNFGDYNALNCYCPFKVYEKVFIKRNVLLIYVWNLRLSCQPLSFFAFSFPCFLISSINFFTSLSETFPSGLWNLHPINSSCLHTQFVLINSLLTCNETRFPVLSLTSLSRPGFYFCSHPKTSQVQEVLLVSSLLPTTCSKCFLHLLFDIWTICLYHVLLLILSVYFWVNSHLLKTWILVYNFHSFSILLFSLLTLASNIDNSFNT